MGCSFCNGHKGSLIMEYKAQIENAKNKQIDTGIKYVWYYSKNWQGKRIIVIETETKALSKGQRDYFSVL